MQCKVISKDFCDVCDDCVIFVQEIMLLMLFIFT